jgi:hypothetical protein
MLVGIKDQSYGRVLHLYATMSGHQTREHAVYT